MAFSRTLATFCLLPASYGLMLTGCAKTISTVGQPVPVKEEPQLASDVSSRVREIQSRVNDLNAASQQLPGNSEQSNRELVQQVFGDLTRILPLIEGEYQSGEFRQGIRVLESARQQLASGSTDLASEPTIGQGLRASLRLLENLNGFVFGQDGEITKKLDVVRQKIDQLDTAHGPMNRVIASQAVRGTADVLQQMSNSLVDRAGLEGKPTTNPATKPDASGTAMAH